MEQVLDFIRSHPGEWGLLIIFVAAALEYLIPPLPADTVVLAGALLVLAGAHSFERVAVAAICGGVLGALGHYALGRACSQPNGALKGQRHFDRLLGEGSIERFFAAFRKYGLWVIALNRAFPGVRAVTFVAAGAARLPLVPVMLAGLVSNVAWTLAILTLGLAVGESWEKIEAAFLVYKRVVYGGAVTLAAAYFLYRYVRRRRALAAAAAPPEED